MTDLKKRQAAVARAEAAIKKIILDLYNNDGVRAEEVVVDTRAFTFGAVDIFWDDGRA